MFAAGLISPKWISPWLEEVNSWPVRERAVEGNVVLE